MIQTVGTFLKEKNLLLFDGGMGTYYSQLCGKISADCEMACLEQPQLVSRIHEEYVAAGCQAIKTNTFGANLVSLRGNVKLLQQLVEAAWNLAQKAAGEKAFVFADIGPVNGMPKRETAEEYCRLADLFMAQGAENFLFETNSTDTGLAEAAQYIRSRKPSAFILTSFAVGPDGYTREGFFYKQLLRRMEESGLMDAVGLNCISNARQLAALAQKVKLSVPLALMPNAGYPVVVHNRTFYEGDPAYFSHSLAQAAAEGVTILGGCCGTTPEHLRQLSSLLENGVEPLPQKVPLAVSKQTCCAPESRFWEKLSQGHKVLAVELDPPKDADSAAFMQKAGILQQAGADIITIADCPIARARMDSSLLACKVKRELGMETLPHLTCRDRNLNATKALVLGLYAEGIQNVLAVTGDPVPTAERDEVKSVYQFNSRKLACFLNSLAQEELGGPLHIFGALNLNAQNFQVQLSLAKQKLENGMVGFLTQPVLTEQALENLALAREKLPKAKILGGIMPVVSEKNARFMDSEVNGIRVSPHIIQQYCGKSRQEGEELAVRISCEVAEKMSHLVDGFYLITPFGRAELSAKILEKIKQL